MYYSQSIRNFLVVVTMLAIGTISLVKIGTIDLHAIFSTGAILIPAIIAMGLLGQKMGEILDNPQNRDDADYKLAVLNALKKMDKKITLQELNEKLTKTVAEPDSPDEPMDDVDI
mgnify:CR=1 FL=1